jgi:tyrosyl-tRNA synthetase
VKPDALKQLPADASVYVGFDPTASSLHLGNLLALISLLHFSIEGHPAIALVGGATGRVGDPSWRSTAKDRLADNLLERHIASIKGQITRFFPTALDYVSTLRPVGRPAPVQVIDNYDWYKDMSLLDFLDRVGSKTRLAALTSRDCIKSRMQSEHGLSFSELAYQLLQAYDFYHLYRQHGCRLQLGGSDQWGNIVSGLDLIGRLCPLDAEAAHGLTMPLLVTANGEKMGKSAGNAVWLDPSLTSPFAVYQYFADMADTDAVANLPKLSFRPLSVLCEMLREHEKRPEKRLAQRQLAFDVTALVHSEAEARRAERASDVLFSSHSAIGADDLDVLAHALRGSAMYQSAPAGSLVGTKLVDLLVLNSNVSKSNPRIVASA